MESLKFCNLDNNSIVKDINALTSVMPPDGKFLHRVEEANDITIKLRPIVQNQRAYNFFAYGLRGTGKTGLILYKLKELKEYTRQKKIKFIYTYSNCGGHGLNNEVNVMIDVIRQIDPEINMPRTGLSKNYVRITFEDLLIQKRIKNIVIVLDEVDALLSGKSGDVLLYYFSRLKDHEKFMHINLSTIIISNAIKVRHFIMDRTSSSFGRDRVDFFQYNAVQLSDIMASRISAALYPDAVEEGVVQMIAGIVAARDGDARRALETLSKCATVSVSRNEKKISMAVVEDACNYLEQDLYMKTINNMSSYQKILFLALLHEAKNGKPNTHYIFKRFFRLCDELGKPTITNRQLQKFISFFVEVALIEAEMTYDKYLGKKTCKVSFVIDKSTRTRAYNELSSDLGVEINDNSEDLHLFMDKVTEK